MSKKLTVISYIGLVVFCAGICFGIWWYLFKNPQSFGSESSQTGVKTKENKSQNKSTDVKYVNNQYKFELTFPKTWEKYGVEESLSDEFLHEKGKTISFGLPKRNKEKTYSFGFSRYYDSIFVISIFTKSQWEQSKNQEFAPKVIEEDTDYVYTYARGNGVVDADGFSPNQPYDDVEKIIKTFRLIKN